MTALAEAQADIDGYVFGAGTTRITIEDIQADAPASVTQDTPMILADGQAFGIDAMAGRTVTITGHVLDDSTTLGVFDDYATLASKWNNPAVRLTPRAVSVLRIRYPGLAGTWRVHGRGRSIAPTLNGAGINLIGFVAAFTTADQFMYSDTEESLSLSLAHAETGTGIAPPFTPPAMLATNPGPFPGAAVNSGIESTWPVIQFNGPVTNPSVTYVADGRSIGLQTVLASGTSVTIDTRPWARSVTDASGGSFAGLLTGNRLADMSLPVGSTIVAFHGQDITGTALCVFKWRAARQIFGGA